MTTDLQQQPAERFSGEPGVYLYASSQGSAGNLIVGNEMYNLGRGSHREQLAYASVVVRENRVHHNRRGIDGFYGALIERNEVYANTDFRSPDTATACRGINATFRDNLVYGNNIGMYGQVSTFERNRVFNNRDWGFYSVTSGRTSWPVNTIYDNGYGLRGIPSTRSGTTSSTITPGAASRSLERVPASASRTTPSIN